MSINPLNVTTVFFSCYVLEAAVELQQTNRCCIGS